MNYRYILEEIIRRGRIFAPTKYLGWVYEIGDTDYFISEAREREKYLIDIPRFGKVKTVHEARIYGFYEVLGRIYNINNFKILYKSVYYSEKEDECFDFEDGEIFIFQCDEGNIIRVGYFNYKEDWEIMGLYGIEHNRVEGTYSYEEYNLLMQMYFGVYDDDKLIRELEEKENRGEFEGLEKIARKDILKMRENENDDEGLKRRLYEYLLLKLSRKSTKGAFEDMEKEYRYGEERLKEMERDIERLKEILESEGDLLKRKRELINRLEEVKKSKNILEAYRLLRYLDRTYGKHMDLHKRAAIIKIVERGKGIVFLPGDDFDRRLQEIEKKINELFYEWRISIIDTQVNLNDLIQSKRIYEEQLKNKQVKPPKISKHYDFRRPEEEQQKAVYELREELKPTVFRIVEAESD